MKKQHRTNALNIRIPAELYQMYAKLCIDHGITKTDGIVNYLKYLQGKHQKKRDLLDEETTDDFNLDA